MRQRDALRVRVGNQRFIEQVQRLTDFLRRLMAA
jgi:hypothetical protein